MKKALKLVSWAFVGFLLLIPIAFATSNVCLDNTTLRRDLNYTFETDTSAKNLTITKNIDCQFGCDNVTHQCAPDPVTINLWFGGGILGLILVIGAIAKYAKVI